MPLVSISNDQRRPVPNANFAATVYHGLPVDLHRPIAHPRGGYVAFLGRISPEKRPDRAIVIARALGIPLKIAAKVDRVDDAYFRTQIEPLLDGPGVEFIGEINERQKTQFLGEAQALLFPIDWPEPFGLSMIEAMACGTPVLAFRCGSVPEIVDDGVTGAIVDTMEEAIAALPRVIALDRNKVRQRFEQRFSATRMAKDYVGVYRSLLEPSKILDAGRRIAHLACGTARTRIDLRPSRCLGSDSTATLVEEIPETPFYVPGTGSSTRPRRTLKHGDCFAVLDSHADIGASPGGPDGIFFCDTRYLSHLEMLLNGKHPLLLGSNVRDDNSILTVDLTNPDIYLDQKLVQPKDMLHVVRTLFLWRGAAYQRMRIQNHGDRPFDVRLTLAFASDFADLFEVRGLRRERRGTAAAELCGPAEVTLNYQGLDGKRRRTMLIFEPAPERLSSSVAPTLSSCSPTKRRSIYVTVKCDPGVGESHSLPFRKSLRAAFNEHKIASRGMPRSSARTRSSTKWCAARWPTSRC